MEAKHMAAAGGTASRAKDPKDLRAWYAKHFGMESSGSMKSEPAKAHQNPLQGLRTGL